jgi:outer membrane protein assembly factor BamB
MGVGPVVDDQHLYVATERKGILGSKHELRALALATGQEKWARALEGNIAMVRDGVVYTDGRRLQAIEAATGREVWSFKGTGRDSARLISGGRIFLTSPRIDYSGTNRVDEGYLYSIDAKTGKVNP